MTLKERFVSKLVLKEKEEFIEELGEAVLLREPDGEGRATMLEIIGAGGVDKGTEQIAAVTRHAGKLLQPCILDPETKEPLFTKDECAELGACNPGVLQELFLIVVGLAGLTTEAETEVKTD